MSEIAEASTFSTTLLCDPYGDLWSIFVNLGLKENPISQCLCDVCYLLTVKFLVSNLYGS